MAPSEASYRSISDESDELDSRQQEIFILCRRQDRANEGLIEWKKIKSVQDWHTLADGCYLLRMNIRDWTDEALWKAHIQLTEAEAAFRNHKSDLSILFRCHGPTSQCQPSK